MGDGVQETLIKIAKETKANKEGREIDNQEAREWFERLRNERFVHLYWVLGRTANDDRFATDVFT